MAEGGGVVSFDEKVAEPGERIGGDWRAEQPPRIPRRDRDDHKQKHEARSDKMPAPRRSFAMLGQIKGPKLFIIAEFHLPFPLRRMRRTATPTMNVAMPTAQYPINIHNGMLGPIVIPYSYCISSIT